MILIVLMYSLFAATFPLAKIAMNYVDAPLFFLSIRMLLAGAGMILASFFLIPKRLLLTAKDFLLLAAAGFFGVFVAFGCEFWAIQFVSSIKVNIFYSLSPFMTAVFAYIFHNQKLSYKKVIGLFIGFLGLLTLSFDSNVVLTSCLPTSAYDVGLIISVASAAYAWFVIKKLLDRGIPMLVVNGGMTFLGGCMCLFTYLLASGGVVIPLVTSWNMMLLCMVGLILISNVIGYTMYGHLLHSYSLTLLSFTGFLCPLFGLLYGYLFMGEAFSWLYVIALVCVFIGLMLFYFDEQSDDSSAYYDE
ncbi:DMT family transporter [Candidatus Dependentiae bacterium]|nr:DMT family transporter [Candidatus Dependentiae bacterium]